MTIERLSDFLGSSYEKYYLQRIYLAQKLEQALLKISPDKIRVVIRRKALVLFCSNTAQAAYLRLKRRDIYAILKKATPVLYAQNMPIQIRVSYGPTLPEPDSPGIE